MVNTGSRDGILRSFQVAMSSFRGVPFSPSFSPPLSCLFLVLVTSPLTFNGEE